MQVARASWSQSLVNFSFYSCGAFLLNYQMGITALRQLLRSLCYSSPWQYAVFWKLKHRTRMILSWEDGYCDHPKLKGCMDIISDGIYFDEVAENSFGSEMNSESVAGYPVEMAVANMSCILSSLGEGVVGKAASTGRHAWFFSDEFPDEWIPQFTAGIKTILLVPVVPHGVVQLGSLETVAENIKLVAHIKVMFNSLQYSEGPSIATSSRDLLSHPPTFILLENFAESSRVNTSLLSTIQSEDPLTYVDDFNLKINKLSTMTPQIRSHIMAQNELQVQGKDLNPISETIAKAEVGDLSVDPNKESVPLIQCTENKNFTGSGILSFSHLEEEDQASLQCCKTPVGVLRNCNTMNMTFNSEGDTMDWTFGEELSNESNYKSRYSLLGFSAESESQKALVPAFQTGGNSYTRDSAMSFHGAYGSLNPVCHNDFPEGANRSRWQSGGWFTDGDDSEELLDAVVQSLFKSGGVRLPTTSSGQLDASCQKQCGSEGSLSIRDNSVPCSHTKSTVVIDENILTSSSTRSSSFKSTVSALVEEKQPKRHGFMQSRKGEKVSHPRRRPNCDIQRPRPRDRQMIQDRVQELRDLVPNGAKCSIDALLDRTIKHMMFLRSVTNQAKKLLCMDPQVAVRKYWKPSEIKGHQTGASWAFEWGSQVEVCPIVIEDINDQGQMLIEMMCEEQGLFFEVAEVIRNLKLTILKGATEYRADKTWAHFIVEASSHFQRMDAFWPLMKLYQRKGKSISSLY